MGVFLAARALPVRSQQFNLAKRLLLCSTSQNRTGKLNLGWVGLFGWKRWLVQKFASSPVLFSWLFMLCMCKLCVNRVTVPFALQQQWRRQSAIRWLYVRVSNCPLFQSIKIVESFAIIFFIACFWWFLKFDEKVVVRRGLV